MFILLQKHAGGFCSCMSDMPWKMPHDTPSMPADVIVWRHGAGLGHKGGWGGWFDKSGRYRYVIEDKDLFIFN